MKGNSWKPVVAGYNVIDWKRIHSSVSHRYRSLNVRNKMDYGFSVILLAFYLKKCFLHLFACGAHLFFLYK